MVSTLVPFKFKIGLAGDEEAGKVVAFKVAVVVFPVIVAEPEFRELVVIFPEFETLVVVVIPVTPKEPVNERLVPLATPILGVINEGELLNTANPKPDLLVKATSKSVELNEPNNVALPEEMIAPVKSALVKLALST